MATLEPIDTLAPGEVIVETPVYTNVHADRGTSVTNLIVWFIIIAVIVWALFALFRPTWVQRRDITGVPLGELDQSRAIIYSLIIALIIVGLVYVFRRN